MPSKGNKLDTAFTSQFQVGLTILLWVSGASLFASGLSASYPFDDPSAETLVISLILVAEAACLFNFLRNRIFRNFITIVQITGWALCFWLRRKELIGDASYGALVALFIISVLVTIRLAVLDRRR